MKEFKELQYGVLHKGTAFPIDYPAQAGQPFYRTDEERLYLYNGSSWSGVGGGDTWLPSNTVLVDPAQAEISGKRYQSITNALTYISTQTPSASSSWGIELSGTNDESFNIPAYVSLIGIGKTILTGAVGSTDSTPTYTAVIHNCEVQNVAVSDSNFLIVDDGYITGGTPFQGYLVAVNGTNVLGGDFTDCNSVSCYYSYLGAVTLPPTLDAQHCYIDFGATGPIFNGGTLKECTYGGHGFFSGGCVFYGGTFFGNLTLNPGQSMVLIGVTGNNNTITINGGFLTSKSLTNINVTYTSGTWNNLGDTYDNRSSKLVSTEFQGAVTELKTLIDVTSGKIVDWTPQQIIQVLPDQPEIVGKTYKTYTSALVYALSQSPSQSNTWGINLPAGSFSEDLVIHPWVRAIGQKSATILTGNITTFAPWSITDHFEYTVENCQVNSFSLSGSNLGVDAQLLGFLDCDLYGYTNLAAGGVFALLGGTVREGNYSSLLMNLFIHSLVLGKGTINFSTGLIANFTDFSNFGGTVNLSGGVLVGCRVENGVTVNAGTYAITNSAIEANVITTGDSYINSSSLNDATVTVQSGDIYIRGSNRGNVIGYPGTTISTYGCPNFTVSTSGTWNNYGDIYKNTLSGLLATNEQAAIDEICTSFNLQKVTDIGSTTSNVITITAPGTGLIVNNDAVIHGKLTVDGDIDPISLTLTNQSASAPALGYTRLFSQNDKLYKKTQNYETIVDTTLDAIVDRRDYASDIDAANALKAALETSYASNTRVFIKNGTYDLGSQTIAVDASVNIIEGESSIDGKRVNILSQADAMPNVTPFDLTSSANRIIKGIHVNINGGLPDGDIYGFLASQSNSYKTQFFDCSVECTNTGYETSVYGFAGALGSPKTSEAYNCYVKSVGTAFDGFINISNCVLDSVLVYGIQTSSNISNIEVINAGQYMFNNCSNIQNIDFGNLNAASAGALFNNCNNIQNVNFAFTANHVNTQTKTFFYGCNQISNVKMDNSSYNFGDSGNSYSVYFFDTCKDISNVYISFNNLYGSSVYGFNYCERVTGFYWNAILNTGTPYVSYSSREMSVGEVILNGTVGTTIAFSGAGTPDESNTIFSTGFSNILVKITSTSNQIHYGFQTCENISNCKVTGSTSIYDQSHYAFSYCTGLSNCLAAAGGSSHKFYAGFTGCTRVVNCTANYAYNGFTSCIAVTNCNALNSYYGYYSCTGVGNRVSGCTNDTYSTTPINGFTGSTSYMDLVIDRASYASDTDAGTALRNALTSSSYRSIYLKGNVSSGYNFNIGTTQIAINGAIQRLEGEFSGIAGYKITIVTGQTSGAAGGSGVLYVSSSANILVKGIEVNCTGSLSGNLAVWDISDNSGDTSSRFHFDNCSVTFSGTYNTYTCVGFYGDSSASRYQVYNFSQFEYCTVTNAQGFFYISGSLLGCRVHNLKGGSGVGIIYGYYGCRNLVNCSTTDVYAGTSAIFFYSCYHLVNCEVVSTNGSASAGSKTGFSNCWRLSNCIVMDDRGSGAWNSNSDTVYGFDTCDVLSNCEMKMSPTTSGSSKDAIGFNSCTNLSSCRAKSWYTSTPAAYVATSRAAGFYGCTGVANCYVCASFNGNSSYNACYYDCKDVTGCECYVVGTIPVAMYGFRGTTANSTASSTAKSYSSCRVNIDTNTSSKVTGYYQVEEISASEVVCTSTVTTSAHSAFEGCNGVTNCVAHGVSSHILIYGFLNCAGTYNNHATYCSVGYNTTAGLLNTQTACTTGETGCTAISTATCSTASSRDN